MKTSRFSDRLILILPIFSIVASAGIVTHQSLRRDRLKQQLTASERVHEALEKRYETLRKAAGEPALAAPAEGDSESHNHHHHDD